MQDTTRYLRLFYSIHDMNDGPLTFRLLSGGADELKGLDFMVGSLGSRKVASMARYTKQLTVLGQHI